MKAIHWCDLLMKVGLLLKWSNVQGGVRVQRVLSEGHGRGTADVVTVCLLV